MIPATTGVLVVGSGPAGSALAGRLAAAGREVLLVDARRHPRPKACAEYASPRIARELERLGLPGETWQASALPLRGMRVLMGEASVQIAYRDRSGPLPAWGVEREQFDATLAAHAVDAGALLAEETAFEELLVADGRVAGAVLRRGNERVAVRARWLMGADGSRSIVARRLGVERPVRYPRRLGLVAHHAAVGELRDHGEMHVGPGWYVGLAPLARERLNVGMALPLDGTRRSAADRFQAALDGLPAVSARLVGSRRLTPIRGVAPIGHRVSRAAGPGWMLVGDAAGFIDPFTGEGIYRALRSARAAAEALAPGDRGAEERYLAARRRALAGKDGLTWLVQGMLAAPPVMEYAMRRLAGRPHLAERLGSALGDCRPSTDALSPLFLAGVLRP